MECENCGHNNVKKSRFCTRENPHSFAKQQINPIFGKITGIIKRDNEDYLIFNERFNNILKMNVGEEVIIEKKRESGQGSDILRQTLNYCVCKGLLEKRREKREKKESHELKYYEIFKRVENRVCEQFLESNFKNGQKRVFCNLEQGEFKESEVN